MKHASNRINQRRIADELGVSVMTVSRALRDHPEISRATKDRIMSAAVNMGYTKIPTQNGKSAVKRVGLFLHQEESFFSNLDLGVIKLIFMAINEECRERQVEVVMEFLKPGDSPVALQNRTIDAAFLLGRYTPETVSLFKDIPTIAVSSFLSGMEIPRITADNEQGSALTTQHLIDLGHKDILFLCEDEAEMTDIFHVRSKGYTLAMIEAGLKPVIIPCKSGDGHKSILPRITKATALVCSSDAKAIDLKRLLIKHGLSIPQDISIAGFDDLESHQIQYTGENITTYAPNWTQLGRMAVDTLVFQPREVLMQPFQIIVPGKLLIRKSTGPARRSPSPTSLE